MRLKFCAIPLLSVCILTAISLGAPAEQETFDSLYAAQIKALNSPAKKAEFAKRLLQDGKTLSADPGLQSIVFQKAYELGATTPAGYATAIDAMEVLAEAQPNRKSFAQDKILTILDRQFRAAPSAQKKPAAQKYLDLAFSLAEEDVAQGELSNAVARYQSASGAADAVGRAASDELAAKLKAVRAKVAAKARLDALKAQVEKKPDDAAAAVELAKMLTLDMDAPAEALPFLEAAKDANLQRMVPLAAKDVANLSEDESLELATWYRSQTKDPKGPAGTTAASRAVACYTRYLELHTREDGARLKAKLALAETEKLAAGSVPVRRVVNLLKLVDLKKSVIAGGWEWTNEGLLCKDAGASVRIKIPYEPPAEYDYRVEFTQLVPGGGPVLNLTHANTEFFWSTGDQNCGFAVVGGKDKYVPSPPGLIKANRRAVVIIKVRKAAVSAFVDDKLIMELKTDYSDFSAPPSTGWQVGAGCFGIGSPSKTVYHKIELVEVNSMRGTGSGEPAARKGRVIDLIPLIDLKSDVMGGDWKIENGRISTKGGLWNRLRIGYEPPSEYDFRIAFTRTGGDEEVDQILCKGGRSFMWNIGGGENKITAFAQIKGQDQGLGNPTYQA